MFPSSFKYYKSLRIEELIASIYCPIPQFSTGKLINSLSMLKHDISIKASMNNLILEMRPSEDRFVWRIF